MKLSEFKPLNKYKEILKEEVNESEVKGKEFYSLVPVVLDQHPEILVRDFLDIDRTFGVIVPSTANYTFVNAIKLYTDVNDIICMTTYSSLEKEGLIPELEMPGFEGFWFQI